MYWICLLIGILVFVVLWGVKKESVGKSLFLAILACLGSLLIVWFLFGGGLEGLFNAGVSGLTSEFSKLL